jgi:hypothetical protein
MLLLPHPSFCSFKPSPHFLATLAGAFPDSDEATIATLEKYQVEQEIVPCNDPKASFTSRELMALVKGRLHLAAKLGGKLRQAVVSIFEALWPGRAVPDDIQTLLQWNLLMSNRVDV